MGQKSCECYRFIRQQYKRLHAGLPQLLYRKGRSPKDLEFAADQAPVVRRAAGLRINAVIEEAHRHDE